jgi:DNA polymerase-3 subunit gamma/tau
LAALWAQIVESVGRASPFAKTYLVEAHPVAFVKNVFTIGFDPEFSDHLGLVDTARNHALLQTKFGELGHPGVQVKFIKAEAPPGWRTAAPAARAAAAPPVAKPVRSAPGAPPPGPAASPVPASKPAAKPKTAPVPFNKDDFKNDPLIQKALEVFRGEIVEVRA